MLSSTTPKCFTFHSSTNLEDGNAWDVVGSTVRVWVPCLSPAVSFNFYNLLSFPSGLPYLPLYYPHTARKKKKRSKLLPPSRQRHCTKQVIFLSCTITISNCYSRYTAPDGTPVHVKFVANENGYQPESDLLPIAPEFPHPIPQFVLDQIEKAALEDAAAAEESDEEWKS